MWSGHLCYWELLSITCLHAGTGKTLLARAVANRTDACFIRVIGSELVQKYVGEGARMVRELFQARPQAFSRPKRRLRIETQPEFFVVCAIGVVEQREVLLSHQAMVMQLSSSACPYSTRVQMARSKKACLIFFDEVDAIGGARFDDGAGELSRHIAQPSEPVL